MVACVSASAISTFSSLCLVSFYLVIQVIRLSNSILVLYTFATKHLLWKLLTAISNLQLAKSGKQENRTAFHLQNQDACILILHLQTFPANDYNGTWFTDSILHMTLTAL